MPLEYRKHNQGIALWKRDNIRMAIVVRKIIRQKGLAQRGSNLDAQTHASHTAEFNLVKGQIYRYTANRGIK
jgi:hypothetical protein